jgi:hypothetical protein
MVGMEGKGIDPRSVILSSPPDGAATAQHSAPLLLFPISTPKTEALQIS